MWYYAICERQCCKNYLIAADIRDSDLKFLYLQKAWNTTLYSSKSLLATQEKDFGLLYASTTTAHMGIQLKNYMVLCDFLKQQWFKHIVFFQLVSELFLVSNICSTALTTILIMRSHLHLASQGMHIRLLWQIAVCRIGNTKRAQI